MKARHKEKRLPSKRGGRGRPGRLPGDEPGPRRQSEGLSLEGTIVEALPNAMFSIQLDDGRKVVGHIPGAMRTRMVRVVPGDRVLLELSPYDLSRGRIVDRRR